MTRQLSAVALVADGYQELDFWYPLMRLQEAGHDVKIVGLQTETPAVGNLDYPVIPHAAASEWNDPADVVIIPGGAGDALAGNSDVLALVKGAYDKGAVIAASGTGAAVLTAAGIAESDRVLTAPSTKALPEHVRSLMTRLAKTAEN